MALRSLAGKLGARLSRWAARDAPPPPPPPVAASELDIFLKEINLEEQALAMESKKRNQKTYRIAGIMVAAGAGIVAFSLSRVKVAFAEALNAKLEMDLMLAMCAREWANAGGAKEEGNTVGAKEEGNAVGANEGNAVGAKQEGNVVDAKEEGNTMDEKQV